MSDQALSAEAYALLAAAIAPLTREAYESLRAKLDAIISRADDPDTLRDVTSEPLLRLNPDEELD